MAGRLLVVDDDAALRRVLELSLAARGYQVGLAATGELALGLARRHPDLIIVDLVLPDMDGLEVISYVRTFSAVPIVVISAREAAEATAVALRAGADDYVVKPFGIDDLVARIRAALRPAAEDEAQDEAEDEEAADEKAGTAGRR
jgi:two-component system, OmpR family, KDP operon response regulator KdpE